VKRIDAVLFSPHARQDRAANAGGRPQRVFCRRADAV